MTCKKENPAAFGDAGGAREVLNAVVELNSRDCSILPTEINHRRAAWLARRFAVSDAVAVTLAALFCFGEARP
jgi:hypothetical protein